MKAKVIIVIALIIVCAITSCANNPSEPASETNHARNQIFDISFTTYTKSSKGISALGSTETASAGNVFQVITFTVKNLSNSVEYFNYMTDTVSIVLSNGHKYIGTFTSYKFMPEATDLVNIYFETLETEIINGATVSFSWGYSDASRCSMTLHYTEPLIKPSDVSGIYALCDPTDGKWEGHCCFKEDGTYWQVIEGIESNGTWGFIGEKGIKINTGKQSIVYDYVSSDTSQFLSLEGAQYYPAVKLSRSVSHFYGFYNGTDLQINNLMVGTWLNYEKGFGFIFNSDKTLGILEYASDSDSWNVTYGSTWSYSNGKISVIVEGSVIASFHVASAYRELYLDYNVFTKYQ